MANSGIAHPHINKSEVHSLISNSVNFEIRAKFYLISACETHFQRQVRLRLFYKVQLFGNEITLNEILTREERVE